MEAVPHLAGRRFCDADDCTGDPPRPHVNRKAAKNQTMASTIKEIKNGELIPLTCLHIAKQDIESIEDFIIYTNANILLMLNTLTSVELTLKDGFIWTCNGTDLHLEIEYSPEISKLTGLPQNGWYDPDSRYKAPNDVTQFKCRSHRLYVYTNIIENSLVGDTSAPILRYFIHQGSSPALCVTNFSHSQYRPLRIPSFEYIHMYITNEFANPPSFSSGPFSATLHFRRRKY